MTCPIEDVECIHLHEWLDERGVPHEHIPNESRSGKKEAVIRGKKLKDMGVSRGYWDYDIYIPVLDLDRKIGAYELVKVEMKRANKNLSTVSKEQKDWGKIYEKSGIKGKICYGAVQAEEYIENLYLEINGEPLKEKRKKVEF